MDSIQFLGLAVSAVITLGSFIAVIMKFTQPINDLRVVIQELIDTMNYLRDDNKRQNDKLGKHDERLDKLDTKVSTLETRMDIYHGEQH